MNVVICDDEIICRQTAVQIVERWATARQLNAAVMVYDFGSTEELLSTWENGLTMDMLFLDIQIPGEMSGLELAKRIRKTDACVSIAFITNYSEFACDGYSVNALRYLRKPIVDAEIYECLNIAYQQWRDAQSSCILIDAQRKKMIINCKQLLYVESYGHYLYLHLTTGESAEVRSNMIAFAERLPSQMFAQCHRSYIVNLLYVRNLTRTALTMSDSTHIPIGSHYIDSIFDAVRLFYQGETRNDLDSL